MSDKHAAEGIDLSKFAPGTVIAVNGETGEFVTGPNEEAALLAFERSFGWGVPARLRVAGAPRFGSRPTSGCLRG